MADADVLGFGAHPDDIEIGCGGTVIKLADAGRSVVLVDMVRGELGTRGSAQIREQEATAAAKLLGVTARENLELEDGNVRPTPEAKRKVAETIRRWRPQMVFLPYCEDVCACELAYAGIFLAGLHRYETGQVAYRPDRLIYYMGWGEFEPTFVVDITAQFERKMEAIYAYSTQFKPDASPDPQTRLTSEETDWFMRSRMAHYGSLIGARYGEGFLIRGRLAVEDPLSLNFSSF